MPVFPSLVKISSQHLRAIQNTFYTNLFSHYLMGRHVVSPSWVCEFIPLESLVIEVLPSVTIALLVVLICNAQLWWRIVTYKTPLAMDRRADVLVISNRAFGEQKDGSGVVIKLWMMVLAPPHVVVFWLSLLIIHYPVVGSLITSLIW